MVDSRPSRRGTGRVRTVRSPNVVYTLPTSWRRTALMLADIGHAYRSGAQRACLSGDRGCGCRPKAWRNQRAQLFSPSISSHRSVAARRCGQAFWRRHHDAHDSNPEQVVAGCGGLGAEVVIERSVYQRPSSSVPLVRAAGTSRRRRARQTGLAIWRDCGSRTSRSPRLVEPFQREPAPDCAEGRSTPKPLSILISGDDMLARIGFYAAVHGAIRSSYA